MSRAATRLFAVVVLYKIRPRESPALQSLLSVAANAAPKHLDLQIVVWDNTPEEGQGIDQIPAGVLYRSAPTNPGLSYAYNQAIQLATEQGYDWLLTLDQDSVLPENFLIRMAELCKELVHIETVGAIVPQVISDGRILSPFYFAFQAIPRWFRPGFVGLSERGVYAANSGSVLRISALRKVGGYNPMFPLDLSDTYLFHRLHNSAKQVFVAGDLRMQHDFALHKKTVRMTIERYDASLRDDCAFWDLYMGPVARLERIVRLAIRVCKEALHHGSEAFRRRTMLELRRRIFHSRSRRIAEWRAWTTTRMKRQA